MATSLKHIRNIISSSPQWFDVDRTGLAKLLARRGKEFILFELIQNAWDEHPTEVSVWLKPGPATGLATLTVEDDSPEGFTNLSHAFTLFAPSRKLTDFGSRGRFNVGEKLVLAISTSARITTTTGTVVFDADGRHIEAAMRSKGSVFEAILPLSAEDLEACAKAVFTLIPPPGIRTTFNGSPLPERTPVATVTETLPTEIADADGCLRRTQRKTTIYIYEYQGDEPALLYEMGIPVVATGDRYHVSIEQKVPLTLERDNVPSGYLARVRACVVEAMSKSLSQEDANAPWVRDAIQSHGDKLGDGTIEHLTTLRFGERRVSYDPSDPESNHRAVADGYTVVHGSQMSAAEWVVAKRAQAILPAGQVTPSPKPFSENGKPLRLLSEEDWTADIRKTVDYIKRISRQLIGHSILAIVANDPGWHFNAAYGGHTMTLNLARLGHAWFSGSLADINRLVLHELGHEYSGNHLSDDYHAALCRLGASLAQLALEQPDLF